MKNGVKAVPDGHHTITPHLVVRNADQAIAFYREVFGAQELGRMPGPDGRRIAHAELQIGDSRLFLCDEFPEWGSLSPLALHGSSTAMHLYLEDVDAVFERAVGAGAKMKMPLSNTFWGDRFGKLTDPFGHDWSLACRIEDLSPAEVRKRADAAFAQMCPPTKRG